MEKYIHYCWFGKKKLPKLAKKCIKSWRKYLPEYKIIEWNEENFDVNITKFSKQAYAEKNWAFVSDVARINALKEMGGIYLDTDMLIKKKIDNDILQADFFAGWESDINVAVGILGAKKGNSVINELFEKYMNLEFNTENIYNITIPVLLTDILLNKFNMEKNSSINQELKGNIKILTRDYFYPISSDKNLPNLFTEKTCTIHYYNGSWLSREEKLHIKFQQCLGYGLGELILKILVKIKHTVKLIKNVIKKIFLILFYPIVKTYKNKQKIQRINLEKQEIDKAFANVQGAKIVFYHKDWIGIKNATNELFGNISIGIRELNDNEIMNYMVKKIADNNIKFIAFSGFANGWDKLIEKLREENSSLIIKTIWHGSICMNIYDYDYTMFKTLFNLLLSKKINSIAFVKKSMYDLFKEKGYSVEFLANNVNIKYDIQQTKDIDNKNVKIGIYASGDRWVKNFYNQLAAASMLENCIVDCIPISNKIFELAKIFKVEVQGLNSTIEHQKLLERMAKNDINMYVTFSECAPIIPLESLELGVPCITGNNHHYFEGTKLQEYLVVDRIDDVNSIYKSIKKCLEHREEIILEYAKWKEKNNLESSETVKRFLED